LKYLGDTGEGDISTQAERTLEVRGGEGIVYYYYGTLGEEG